MDHLAVLRHGQAASAAGGDDLGRPLTAEGRSQARRAGAWLAGLVRVDDAVCSPAARATETARLALASGPTAPATLRIDARIYEADVAALRRVVDSSPARALLMVGHNPGCQDLAEHLLGPAWAGRLLRPGGGVLLRLGGSLRAGTAELVAAIDPGADL